jgi:hypothetical protein
MSVETDIYDAYDDDDAYEYEDEYGEYYEDEDGNIYYADEEYDEDEFTDSATSDSQELSEPAEPVQITKTTTTSKTIKIHTADEDAGSSSNADDDDDYWDEEDDDVSTEKKSALSYEEIMNTSALNIFKSMLSGEEGSAEQLKYFRESMSPDLFYDEQYAIALMIQQKVKTGKAPKPNLYRNRLQQLKGDITKWDGVHIQLANYPEVGGAKEMGFIDAVIKCYTEYMNAKEYIPMEDFEANVEAYKTYYREVKTVETYKRSETILTTGLGSGRRRLFGFEDSITYVKKRLAEIDGLLNNEAGKGFLDMNEVMDRMNEETAAAEMICDYGPIPTLNDAYGGIYRGDFYQIMAPPKAGKSKWCASICHRAVVKEHKNVTVWPVEGGAEMWAAQMRAIHCYYYYNEKYAKSGKIIPTPDQGQILDMRMSDEMRELEKVSFDDLRNNPLYGNVQIIDRPFKVETFIEEIETGVNLNNSVLVIIDYLQLIDSESSHKAPHDILASAYKRLLAFAKKKRPDNQGTAVLTPVQYKQETVNALAAGADASQDLRTGAAGSAEVIRTPDQTLAMWGSTQDLENGIERLMTMPNRKGKPLPEIVLDVDLAHCIFAERRSN